MDDFIQAILNNDKCRFEIRFVIMAEKLKTANGEHWNPSSSRLADLNIENFLIFLKVSCLRATAESSWRCPTEFARSLPSTRVSRRALRRSGDSTSDGRRRARGSGSIV